MVRRVEPRRQEVPDLAVRLVLALPLLVLHHAALLVELGLADGADEMAHAVGLEPEREVERGDGHVVEVVGAVLVGGAVEVGGAGPLERILEFLVVVLAPVEHQVLEEVGEAGASGLLVLGAHVVPDVHRHDRRLVVLVDDQREAVGEDEPLVGNVRRALCGQRDGTREHGQRGTEAGATTPHGTSLRPTHRRRQGRRAPGAPSGAARQARRASPGTRCQARGRGGARWTRRSCSRRRGP